jgi:hypothetical protein
MVQGLMERVKDLNMDEEQMMKDIQKGRYNHSLSYIFLAEKQFCGSEIFFPDQIIFKYFNPKNWFLSSRKHDPGFSSRILLFYPSRIQGSKRHRIRNTALKNSLPL